jgi:outer membrane protein assembly factor BamD (BamD/ComL family)
MFYQKGIQIILLFIFISFRLSAAIKPLLNAPFIALYDSARSKINQQNYFEAFDYLNKIKYSEEHRSNLYLQAAAEYT